MGKLKPNVGRQDEHLDWKELLLCSQVSGLQKYSTKVMEEDLKCLVSPLYVNQIPKAYRHVSNSERIVGVLLKRKDGRGVMEDVVEMLD